VFFLGVENEPGDAVNELAIGHRYEEAAYYTKRQREQRPNPGITRGTGMRGG
jgi:hypothetical protein